MEHSSEICNYFSDCPSMNLSLSSLKDKEKEQEEEEENKITQKRKSG